MITSSAPGRSVSTFVPDSPAAWRRLLIALAIAAVGTVGTWSVVVVLPMVQAELGVTRGAASLAYTLAMIGFALGGVVTGRLTDRLGIIPAMGMGILSLLFGYLGAGISTALWQFAVAHFFIGLGASATFAPLMAEASRWFVRRRGIAVGIAGSGYYLSGAFWPPLIERGIAQYGWQMTHIALGILCGAAMTVLLLILRLSIGRSQQRSLGTEGRPSVDIDLSPNALTAVLSVASFFCCTAMAVPQVHIVALCGDLGYGVARGVEMLSLMLAFGAVSRIGSGLIADRLGGLATLLIGSVAQASALTMYLFFDGLTPLYVVSALFGLFHGGIVSSYAIIVRETMPTREAATRVGTVIMVSLFGMSFGGWISGVIFDMTGSYKVAFLNGLGWNALNVATVLLLLLRSRRRAAFA
ncbi:MFS transporter [Methylobacterium nodulans]|uniref:Major facilitator superfamily MFS_1 n=1 Tax=Methylobacterium nodulans (strain LMG 21967 / CNCM I-2342 / ORS 2060) TaxID=460265 RepID=B8IXS4_METNO|nr:MFS transporter [Methylobacterium nodulans]ACL62906.1 major facilitator superfamily MFS_1 [Methylobacterium nodulans ORS 2060]